MNDIYFTLPIKPVPQARPRFTKNGVVYDTQKCKDYKSIVRVAAKKAMGDNPPCLSGVGVTLTFGISTPKSWSDKKKRKAMSYEFLPTSRPDLDNYVKAVLDACNGVVYKDDGQIFSIIATKRYHELPSVYVGFFFVEEEQK